MTTITRTMRCCAASALAVLPLLHATPARGADAPWLHVRIEERGADGESVRLDLPLDAVERMLPLARLEDDASGAMLEGLGPWEGVDLGELARALRESPDADFVTVTSRDETLRVGKEANDLVVRADEGSERVHVRVPLSVVEALATDDPERLDLAAGLRALAAAGGGALVDIESEDEHVRVWVDHSEAGKLP